MRLKEITSEWLYHGTSAAAAVNIVTEDSFMAEDTHGDGLGLGLSLTRNFSIAKRFAKVSSDSWLQFGDEEWSPGWAEKLVRGTGGIILCFKRQHIANMLVPIVQPESNNGFGYKINNREVNDEEEERLIAPKGQNRIMGARNMIDSIKLINKLKFTQYCDKLMELEPEYQDAINFLQSKST